jgi:hypothetical protein
LQSHRQGQEAIVKSGNSRRTPTAPIVRDEGAPIADGEDDGSGAVAGGGDPAAADGFRRRFYVFHQQELARRALSLGSPGAARAAMRALQGVDFEEAATALAWLRVIRDVTAYSDQVVEAIKELLVMEPRGGFPPGEAERRQTGRGPRLVR